MELLNIITARTVWLFDIRELNPRGKTIVSELIEWLREDYHFEKAPSSVTDLDKNTQALVFERGQFQVNPDIFVDVGLKIYNDGLIAETQSSTHGAESFLKDLLEGAAKEFGLAYKPQMIRTKLYFSELHIHSAKNLVGINPKLEGFAAKIVGLIPAKLDISYEFAGIAFWPAQIMPNILLAPFRFERKIGTLPNENKYYSTAPLHTDDHLNLLNDFESSFMA